MKKTENIMDLISKDMYTEDIACTKCGKKEKPTTLLDNKGICSECGNRVDIKWSI